MSEYQRATRKGHGFTEATRIIYGGTGITPGTGPLAGLTGTTRCIPYVGNVFIPESGEFAGREMDMGGVATKFWAKEAE